MSKEPEIRAHRILVVDDNPSIHEDFRKILCPTGFESGEAAASLAEELFGEAENKKQAVRFEMDSAFQGQEALAMIHAAETESRPYSLAFIDVRMPPGWDGVETIAHIWRVYPHVQVVICTAYSDYSWYQIKERLGETDNLVILKKPFDNVEVLQLAHTLTRKWLQTQQVNTRMALLDEMVSNRTRELLEAKETLQNETHRRATIETAIGESAERFHQTFESLTIPLALRSLSTGEFIDVNQSFLDLTEHTKAEILGKGAEELNLLVAPEAHAKLVETARGGTKVREAELAIRRKGGEVRETLTSMEALRVGDNTCLLTAMQDVTEQRAIEQQLMQSQKMEAVDQLAAGVAHDFNNLLTVIHGHTSLQLAKSNLDGQVTKAFTQVKLASERAIALTRQLMAFTRQQILDFSPLDLSKVMSEMSESLTRIVGGAIQIEYRLEPELPLVRGDRASIEQAIQNLVQNAREAMPEGGTLTLSTTVTKSRREWAESHGAPTSEEFVLLTVTDTGCGMKKEILNRIFEPFFTTKPIGNGAGLGLSTVYGTAKRHGGWIDVESQPGAGASFRLYLPSAELRPGKEAADAPSQSGSQEASVESPEAPSILVLEDDPESRNVITSTLEAAGYRVIESSSGTEALLRWKENQGDVRLVITEMVIPDGRGGRTLAERLLRRDPQLRIIYTSNYTADVAANALNLREGINFLQKPVHPGRLLSTVHHAFGAGITREFRSAMPAGH